MAFFSYYEKFIYRNELQYWTNNYLSEFLVSDIMILKIELFFFHVYRQSTNKTIIFKLKHIFQKQNGTSIQWQTNERDVHHSFACPNYNVSNTQSISQSIQQINIFILSFQFSCSHHVLSSRSPILYIAYLYSIGICT